MPNKDKRSGKTTIRFSDFENRSVITTNGRSQEIPDPLCRAAIVVGPPKEGIQKKPSVSSPSFATFERAWYKPIQTGIVANVGKHPVNHKKTNKVLTCIGII